MLVECDDAELARVVDVREQELGGRGMRVLVVQFELAGPARFEAVDDALQVLLHHVVAEVHDEVVVAEERARDEDAVREPERLAVAGCT